VGEPQDFFKICSQLDNKRRTIFKAMLQIEMSAEEYKQPCSYVPEKMVPSELLEVMNKHEPCVLTFSEVVKANATKRQE